MNNAKKIAIFFFTQNEQFSEFGFNERLVLRAVKLQKFLCKISAGFVAFRVTKKRRLKKIVNSTPKMKI